MHYRVKVSSYVGFSESQMIIDHQEEILKRKVSQEPQEERSSRSSRGKILKIIERKDPQDPQEDRFSRGIFLKSLKRKNPSSRSLWGKILDRLKRKDPHEERFSRGKFLKRLKVHYFEIEQDIYYKKQPPEFCIDKCFNFLYKLKFLDCLARPKVRQILQKRACIGTLLVGAA